MSLRGFLIVIVCRARNINTEAAFANWLAPKQGALFSLIYFFGSFCVYYIPRNYVIPQTMPHAIPQTHSSFYPYRTTDHSVWQVRRLVAATRCGDTSKRQIASCVLENFCENLCLCNRNLSQKFCLIWFFCNMLLRQNSVAETKIFTPVHTKRFQRHVAAFCPLVCTDLTRSISDTSISHSRLR